MVEESPKPTPRWFHATAPPARGVALVLHGLNLKPAKMDGLADALAGLGIDCYRAVLTGHDGDLSALREVTRATFLADASSAYDAAAARARELGVPLFLVGFSLGAVVGNDLLHEREDVRFDGMALFAPAFTPHRATGIVRALAPFRRLVIPSASPREFRANVGSSVAAYLALFDAIAALEARRYVRASRVPAVIFIDPLDELVSHRGLARLIRRHALDRWQVVEVSNRGHQLRRSLHHLIAGPAEVGPTQWEAIRAAIARQFFSETGRAHAHSS